jgi:hypothetical protein
MPRKAKTRSKRPPAAVADSASLGEARRSRGASARAGKPGKGLSSAQSSRTPETEPPKDKRLDDF